MSGVVTWREASDHQVPNAGKFDWGHKSPVLRKASVNSLAHNFLTPVDRTQSRSTCFTKHKSALANTRKSQLGKLTYIDEGDHDFLQVPALI